MTISKIEVWNFSPPFRDGPYAMSHVTSGHVYGRILRVSDDEGGSGIGEVVFSPALAAPARERRIADEANYLEPLVGQPLDALLELAAEARGRDKSWRGIAFALETAWYDREGKRTRQSVGELLGGALQADVADYFSISEKTLDGIRRRMDIAGPECRVLQLKLGVGTREQDAAQIAAILERMTADQIVQADANGGWTVEEACDIIGRFDDARIVWEEPCTAYADNVSVAEKTARHVMVDQCVGDRDMAIRAIDEGAAQSICIKPAPLGGLTVARLVRDHAIRAGMRVRIDGPWCGDIASAAILHLALGMPEALLFSGCDLREPIALPFDLDGVRHTRGNRIAPAEGYGLGITLPGDLLGLPEKSFGGA